MRLEVTSVQAPSFFSFKSTEKKLEACNRTRRGPSSPLSFFFSLSLDAVFGQDGSGATIPPFFFPPEAGDMIQRQNFGTGDPCKEPQRGPELFPFFLPPQRERHPRVLKIIRNGKSSDLLEPHKPPFFLSPSPPPFPPPRSEFWVDRPSFFPPFSR